MEYTHKPVLLHVRTYKGKGYQYAEQDPTIYHGLSGFDVTTGDTGEKSQSFSDEFGQTLCCLARENEKLCAITAAMADGTGLTPFAKAYPERFFDVAWAASGRSSAAASSMWAFPRSTPSPLPAAWRQGGCSRCSPCTPPSCSVPTMS